MKNHIRDYATAAYRFYAQCGSKDKYINNLISDMKKQQASGSRNPTEAVLIHKEKIMQEKAAELADLEAVEKALNMLDSDIRKAVDMVYFRESWNELSKGDIEARVHYACTYLPASERNVYRWLVKARLVFAQERGLRI